MCYPNGGVVDDLLVYMRGTDDYFLCINAGNIDKDLAWIREQAAKFDVTITDRSADYALLAVQGPRAAAIVQSLTGAKLGVGEVLSFHGRDRRGRAMHAQSHRLHRRGWL